MNAELKRHRVGRTLVLTISNPQHRNALSPDLYVEGIEALNLAESSKDLGSVIITGEGHLFSAGGNLQRLQANRQRDPAVQAQSLDALHNWIETIRAFPKPVIAAVEGAAAGAGFSLALACDLIVAARDAVFTMAYSKLALSPDGGASWSLSQALPRQLVTELLMCGERIGAPRLAELGVVNRMTEPSQALTDALTLADRLNGGAANALASIKTLINEAARNDLSGQLTLERAHFVQNLHHPNAGRGIEAFLSKRSPQFE
ncbi:oxepin-CoA hydrolase, alternative type [Rhodoferax sp.]|uniref:oxepin-CoA hydrolase, alternative type n=1 Tax=Rhodoferax sp. TaxID=50421 RepID=UPI002760B0C9|nr:enoyl-CoA hydratase [Rhodoferax sp.]